MALFGFLRSSRRRRIFDAAAAIFLGWYLPRTFDDATRRRIDAEVDDMSKEFDCGAAAFRNSAPWYVLGATCAVAMARLGIPPGHGCNWDALIPRVRQPVRWDAFPSMSAGFTWQEYGLNPDARIAAITRYFHPYHAATEEARRFLRDNGLELPDSDPSSTSAPSAQPSAAR